MAIGLLLGLVLTWAGVGFWNVLKPLPPGVHTASVTTRLAESDVDLLLGAAGTRGTLVRELKLIDHAEQLIVIDQSPVAREISQALILRQHTHPHLKIIVLTDPRPMSLGGTPPQDLNAMERGGIIVARVRLDALRDSNPLYSAAWRMAIQWWSDPFAELAGDDSLQSRLRTLNFKADRRQVLVADDGAGGWTSIMGASQGSIGVVLRGAPAHDIVAGELQVVAWSSDDDRLPSAPPPGPRGIGTIDTRYLTEGAIAGALFDAIAATAAGDLIAIAVGHLADRRAMAALKAAAARGVRVQVLLDADKPLPNHGAAVELDRDHSGNIGLRWHSTPVEMHVLVIRHRDDVVMYLISASLTRRELEDLDLTSGVELRMPARAAPAQAALDYFAAAWADGSTSPFSLDDPDWLYARFRIAEATGISEF